MAVNDTLTDAAFKKPLEKCLKLAKDLRNPNNFERIRSLKLKSAKRDSATRWNSVYEMVASLVDLKDFCANEKIAVLNETDWSFCDDFLKVFKPVKIATKMLQDQDLGFGDFFKIWLDMTLRVEQLAVFASCLHKRLIERGAMLLKDIDTLLAALYLDPRFRRISKKMKHENFDESRARSHLISIFKLVTLLRPLSQKVVEGDTEPTVSPGPSTSANAESERKDDAKILENTLQNCSTILEMRTLNWKTMCRRQYSPFGITTTRSH